MTQPVERETPSRFMHWMQGVMPRLTPVHVCCIALSEGGWWTRGQEEHRFRW